jgi:hypothetical protein
VALRLGQPNSARFPQVTLYAYPTDGRGLLIPNLPPGAFSVTENGSPAEVLKADRDRAQALEHLLAQKFERWAELDAKAAGSS